MGRPACTRVHFTFFTFKKKKSFLDKQKTKKKKKNNIPLSTVYYEQAY